MRVADLRDAPQRAFRRQGRRDVGRVANALLTALTLTSATIGRGLTIVGDGVAHYHGDRHLDGWDDDGGVWVDPNATHVGMISPHGRFRVGWDLATALLLVYVAVIEPLRLGWPSYFASESGEGQWRNQASTVPFRPLSRE